MSDFGPPPEGTTWFAAHATATTVRLAAGKWHSLLAYRVLAFSGANVKAVAVFHAGLPEIKTDDAKKFAGKLGVYHGAADTFIPDEKVNAFRKVLDEAGTKYDFVAYPGACLLYPSPSPRDRTRPRMPSSA